MTSGVNTLSRAIVTRRALARDRAQYPGEPEEPRSLHFPPRLQGETTWPITLFLGIN